tara:strand:+ start:198 stop:362 length:165 start_codon:yes stop_codon:yes gene_type:complete
MMNNISEVRVIKLKDTHPDEKGHASDMMATFRIWSLLGGAEQMRDRTVANRFLG